jgi:hypothetical protein
VVRLSSMLGRKGKTVSFRRCTAGTTLAEYAIMLFLIIVICAVGVKVLGMTIEKRVGAANKHMSGQAQTSSAGAQSGENAQAANSAAAAANADKSKATVDVNKDPTAGKGDAGDNQSGGLPFLVRFALIALGVIGAAAAFLAMSKGKPSGG